MPIIIGHLEAQAIKVMMVKYHPPRPLTHDLFPTLTLHLGTELKKIVIYKAKDGVFYSYLVCEQYGQTVNVDARTSDALAIALHRHCPIYIEEELLNAQCMRDEGGGAYSMPITVMNTEVLRGVLKTAIEREDYELAAHLRDVIRDREENEN